MSAFILDYFQEKLMTKFPESPKKYFGANLGLFFSQIWSKMHFMQKKTQFLDIPIIYHRVKTQKKTNKPFLRKMLNWLIDRQTDNSDFIGPSTT